MKLGILMILILLLISCLPAITYSTDDSIDLLLLSGRFQKIGSYLFYVPLIYDDPIVTSSEDTAIDCLANAGVTFAIVQKNLENFTSTPDTEQMKLVSGLAFPYVKAGTEYMALINLSWICDGFDRNTIAALNEDQRFERCRRIVIQHAIHENMDEDY